MQLTRGRLTYRHVAVGAAASLLLLGTFYHLHRTERLSFSLVGSEQEALDSITEDVGTPAPGGYSQVDWNSRAELVKQAFQHAYHAYEKHAMPHDELLPLSMRVNKGTDNFNGWGVTMYDSLDTMLLMGLNEEFGRALPYIEAANFTLKAKDPTIHRPLYAPFFETVIRYLGGLLSAYALSHEPILLQRADDLATKLSPVFNTGSGLPAFGVNTQSGEISSARIGILAEVASCQLEYTYLARMTGKAEHYDNAAKIMRVLEQANLTTLGMLPKQWNLTSGEALGEQLSVGAAADSGHEYLLKLYLLSAQSDEASLDLYVKTINRILTTLLYVSPKRGLLYVTDTFLSSSTPVPSHKFEHLSCFLPGLIALGAHTIPDDAFKRSMAKARRPDMLDEVELSRYDWRQLHMLAAEGLAESCYQMYDDQATGLGPDEVMFHAGTLWIHEMREWRMKGKAGKIPGLNAKSASSSAEWDYAIRAGRYMLRPETVESIYLMYRTTKSERWRERGWDIFQSLEREARRDIGYASIVHVNMSPAVHKDEMPSYFLAETLKYLFLLFREDDLVPLDRWVFNTEAHPLPIFDWSSWERVKYGIP